MAAVKPEFEWFQNARYGLFMHYGLYSLLGRDAPHPIGANARNFLVAVPMAVGVSLLTAGAMRVTPRSASEPSPTT